MKRITTLLWRPSWCCKLRTPLLGLLCFLNAALTAQAETLQQQIIGNSQAFLEAITEQYLTENSISGRYQAKIGRLDPRLRLPPCPAPLQISLESPPQPIGRVTLRVRCESHTPWTIFVPGHVNLYREVVTALRSLSRNSVIQAADVQLSERDISSLRQGYILDLKDVIGQKVTRPVQPDQTLSANALKAPPAISKGDEVVISARSHSMHVRMPGSALEEGAIGQQIRVRNNSSQRIIHARVIAPGQVEVVM